MFGLYFEKKNSFLKISFNQIFRIFNKNLCNYLVINYLVKYLKFVNPFIILLFLKNSIKYYLIKSSKGGNYVTNK